MSLRPSLERLKTDKRMMDINIKGRTLSKDELAKQLKDLPDLADKAQKLSFNHNLEKDRSN